MTRALAFLYERCGDAPAWQANEALALAFDDYCAAVGYEQARRTVAKFALERAVKQDLSLRELYA